MAAVTECMEGSGKHLVKPARSIIADGRALQLKIAKQILAEVFHTRLCDVEDMIMKRLVEKDRIEEKYRPDEEHRVKENGNHVNWGTWPEMLWIEDDIKS